VPKAVLYFSSVYYNLTDANQQGTQSVITNVHLDTGGSQSLASDYLLHNVKKAEDYGHSQIYMVTVNGNSPAYDRMGELNFNDEDGKPIIILCYVQVQSIKGHDNFVLISNNTLDDIQTDINYHSNMSRHVGVVPLRRLSKQLYHYSDTYKHISHKNESVTKEQSSSVVEDDTTMLTVEETDDTAFSVEAPETCQCDCQPRIAELLCQILYIRYQYLVIL
jgi:hypothetical protein